MYDLVSIGQRLEEQGYRITPSRLAVVEAALEHSGHFSVDDILSRLPGVGRATVFRTMKLLSQMGILCRILLEDGSLRYRVSHRRDHHHHLVCVSCGGVEELDACIAAGAIDDLARSTGYDIEGHWLEFYGRCGPCRSGQAQKKGAQRRERRQ
jgi:Fur family ferric uptake transcriptional regulator